MMQVPSFRTSALVLQNGNLHLDIPLFTAKQRGGRVTAYHFVYDSPRWTLTYYAGTGRGTDYTVVNPAVNEGDQNGRIIASDSYSIKWSSSTTTCTIGTTTYTHNLYSNFLVVDSNGTKHPVLLQYEAGSPHCTQTQLTGTTTDGSGFYVDISAAFGTNYPDSSKMKAWRNDGTQVYPTWIDPNGNSYETLGRTLVTTTSGTNYQTLSFVNSNGGTQTYRFDLTTAMGTQTSFCSLARTTTCYEATPGGNGGLLVSKITLPNGMFYSFTYSQDGMSRLTSITLPTGGTITYTYVARSYASPDWRNTPVSVKSAVTSRSVISDGQTSTWTYSGTGSLRTVQLPTGDTEEHTYSALNASYTTVETMVRTLHAGAALKTVTKDYTWEGNPQTGDIMNQRQIRETVTLDNGLVKKTETDYETFSATYAGIAYTGMRLNPVERREYDFGQGAPGGLLRRTHFTYLHNGSSQYLSRNIVDRATLKQVYDGSSNLKAQTQTDYDTTAVGQTSGIVAHDYVNFPYTMIYRGNPTAVKTWRNTDGAWPTSTNFYNDLGNLTQAQDPLLHPTTFDYSDNWADPTCATAGQSNAYLTTITNALGHQVHNKYNSCTGSISASTDANNQTISLTYDFFDRVTGVSFPDGGHVTNAPNDSMNYQVTHTVTAAPNPNLVTLASYDGVGRLRQTQLTSDLEGIDKQDTTYDSMGRVHCVSNPYRGSATDGSVCTDYDALNRATKVTKQNNDFVQTVYSGNVTTTTDEASKPRRTYTDALGRLSRVDEPLPAGDLSTPYTTLYFYDTLDNLTCVEQRGNVTGTGCAADPASDATSPWRVRRFTYNSLSELLSARNPEVNNIIYTTYAYNSDGVLTSKTDPRGITINYDPSDSRIDVLHRVTKKTYSNGDTPVTYRYDETSDNGLTITNGKGRTTGMSDVSGITAWSYDPRGRTLAERRTVNGITKLISYIYDATGAIRTITYPSGRVITYDQSPAGHILAVKDLSNNINYATNATYAPFGGLTGLQYGAAPITITNTYDIRSQPNTMTAGVSGNPLLMSRSYDFHVSAGGDNGNVWGITDGLDDPNSATRPIGSAAYTYDNLNRITSASTTGTNCDALAGTNATRNYGNTYAVDAWGNLYQKSVTKCNAESLNESVGNNNQFSPSTRYDAAGNMTASQTQNNQYIYNAESQLIGLAGDPAPPTLPRYLFDGEGVRVGKTLGNVTSYWNGPAGPLAESDGSGNITAEYVFFGGSRIARIDVAALNSVNSVTVRFTNDSCSGCGGTPVGGGDRNLFVNYITVGTTNILPGDPTLVYTPSGCNGPWYGVGTLACNGDMVATGSFGSVGSITVNAYGSEDYSIYPHIQLLVNGAVVAEWDVTGASRSFTYTPTHYYLSDHIGSATVIASEVGTTESEQMYFPYGGERWTAGTDPNHYKFTGKERDSESGLDYFGARYYGSNMGRFTSADPKRIGLRHLLNPQKLNRYSYVLNNPLALFDPDGQEEKTITYRAFIPTQTTSVAGFVYAGDNRSFSTAQNASSRVSLSVTIETDAAKNPSGLVSMGKPQAGMSVELFPTIKTGFATQGLPHADVSRDANGNVVVNFQSNTKNPIGPAGESLEPGIRADATVKVSPDGTQSSAGGVFSGYPSHEINMTDSNGTVPLLQVPAGNQPTDLFKNTVVPPQETVRPPACAQDKKGCN